ncbi:MULTISPECIES: rhodanese-like domain-containing protein [unclassified Lacinutrix]|uniref:rhodanese-like domain-containing protein n=1 Tax=unclassified Lacinutrix TaxID=2647285 RepID=UPI00020A3320|nr:MULTISPECIES: rhodanese-like domain-containing protein [unclassified Lacinutrix]AEH01453.1 Rhodanese-like protein [Lacinutrix sp. 5H-3-7-4]OIQ21231.1 MAG: sulfurtransferase [Lacinutrix sp. MedPE-SW]
MGFLDFIFGAKKRQVETYLNNGAVILDVRSQREWDKGHIENAVHIPIDELNNRVDEVKALNKPIIACCESGVRSAKAAKFLNLNNISAINGGGWIGLKKKL